MNAEYTFYNPTDKDITAKLLFPMGNIPENALYVTEEDNIWPYDLDKYDVLVNDEVIDKKVRHIYMGEGSVFKAKQALGKIENDYVENEFYTPDLPVTKYTYKIEDLGKDDGWYLDIKMIIPKWNEKTKYLFPSIWEWNINEKDKMATIEESVFADETYDIYVLGENVEPVLTAEITEYEENEILDAKFIVEKTEQMTFLEFVKLQNDERYHISETDWYNIAVSCLEKNTNAQYLINGYEYASQDIYTHLMRWYEYDLTISAKETVVNKVTAPIYPAYDEDESPNRYKYIYYLSPAKEWKKFGDLTIEIHTPYHLNSTNFGEFVETEEGYKYEMEGLPDSELEFVMSKTSDPDNV